MGVTNYNAAVNYNAAINYNGLVADIPLEEQSSLGGKPDKRLKKDEPDKLYHEPLGTVYDGLEDIIFPPAVEVAPPPPRAEPPTNDNISAKPPAKADGFAETLRLLQEQQRLQELEDEEMAVILMLAA